MVRTVILNSTNVVKDANQNTLTYSFQGGGVDLSNYQVALGSIQLYYSWRNINSTLYNNSQFNYIWFDGLTYSISIPNGFYTIPQLNAYLQFVMISNRHYMLTGNSTNVYFLELVTNAQLYNIQLNCYPLSTSLASASSWTIPAGATWTIPTQSQTASIQILNNRFTDIIGFVAGTYPPTAHSTLYSAVSSYCPQVSPVNSLLISCSMVSSPLGVPTNIIYSFSPNAQYGSLISSSPPNFAFCDVLNARYTDFTLRILDQNGSNIQLLDTSLVISLLFKPKEEMISK